MLKLLTPEWKKDPHKWLEKYGCEGGQDIEACEAGTPFDFAAFGEENQFNQQKHDDIVRNLSDDHISRRVKYYKQLISPKIEKKYRVMKNKKNPFKRNTEKYLYITKGVHWNIYFSDGDYQLAESLPIDVISGSSPLNGSIVGWNVSKSEDKKIGSYTIPGNLNKIILSDPHSDEKGKYSGNDNSKYINPIELVVIRPAESDALNEELFQNLKLATTIHDVPLVGGGIRKLNKKSKKRKTRKKRKSKRRKRSSRKSKTKRRRR
jgi:hypothetical protein